MNKKISKSPARHSFQKESYLRRVAKEGGKPREDYLRIFDQVREQREKLELDPEWQKDNLEYDLRITDWILEKARISRVYSQNLYAALCNNEFVKNESWNILKDDRWNCSWRHAGGIVADMREEGDYIEWYCSGLMQEGQYVSGYVDEGTVTDEIEKDLLKLGWLVAKNST